MFERACRDVVVVDVRDLELATGRRLEPLDHLEDVRVVAVNAGHREPARRVLRLLDDLGDASVDDPRHAEMAQVLRLAHVREQHAGTGGLGLEVAHRVGDRAAEDVVGEHDDDAVAAGEATGEAERLGDPAGALLLRIAELVAEVALEVLDMIGAGDEQELLNAGLAQEVDGPLDHRLPADGEQMLVGDAGQRIETRPGPACQDDAFHARDAKRLRSKATA